MSDRSGSQASASVREGSNGRIVIEKQSVASKDSMFFPDVTIDPEVGLILIVRLGRRSDVIAWASEIRQRVVLKDLEAESVETRCRNRVIWKRRARGGRGIEDRLRENSLPLCQRGNHAQPGDAGAQARPLPIREEKQSCCFGWGRPG